MKKIFTKNFPAKGLAQFLSGLFAILSVLKLVTILLGKDPNENLKIS